MAKTLTDEEIAAIRRNYKRCDEATQEAIIRFRQTGDATEVEAIGRGIIRRYLKPEAQVALDGASAETPLTALQVESLTMLEIVLDLQDALNITIADEELRRFATLGDVLAYLRTKAGG